MTYFVISIVIIIIFVQLTFFMKNWKRMNEFSNIFDNDASWLLKHDSETHLVEGVEGSGNTIFDSIEKSINKYLENNKGSIIDFALIKDSVDRHCDSVENDISTQTPLPLYWGLAGTMIGVILGLWELLQNKTILSLLGDVDAIQKISSDSAAKGVTGLLEGIAWAMAASICGILLTTISSIRFKRCKLEEEKGKNTFLAWMQSSLLPELPTDTSQAFNKFVGNLNRFNNSFANNTAKLNDALAKVNETYEYQAQIITAVHDMDVMKMAEANINVLGQLQQCTDKLERFNQYLIAVEGYTNAIHRFEEKLSQESGRLQVLEEIRDFFGRHKAEIAKMTADADDELQKSLRQVRENTRENVAELHKQIIDQSETFKEILKDERESLQNLATDTKKAFATQMQTMPALMKRLDEISTIPAIIDKLIEKVEKSNDRLVGTLVKGFKNPANPPNGSIIGESHSVKWIKLTGLSSIILIALSCLWFVIKDLFGTTPTESKTEALVETVDTLTTTPIEEKTIPVEDSIKPETSIPNKTIIENKTVIETKEESAKSKSLTSNKPKFRTKNRSKK